MLADSAIHVLRTFKEALKDKGWYDTIKSEFDTLIRNKTWILIPAPPGRKIIDKKGLFRVE